MDIELAAVNYTGNEEFLYQVWLNIMDNAIKYNQINGQIHIKLFETATEIVLEVTDSGVGMKRPEIECLKNFIKEIQVVKFLGMG